MRIRHFRCFGLLPVFFSLSMLGCGLTHQTRAIREVEAESLSAPNLVTAQPTPGTFGLQLSMTQAMPVGGPPRLASYIREWDGEDDDRYLAAPGDYRIKREERGYQARMFLSVNERLVVFGGAAGGWLKGDAFSSGHAGFGIVFPFSAVTLMVTPVLAVNENRYRYADSVRTYSDAFPLAIDSTRFESGAGEGLHATTALAFTLCRPVASGRVLLPYIGYQFSKDWMRTRYHPSEVLEVKTHSLQGGMRARIAEGAAIDISLGRHRIGNGRGSDTFTRAEAGLTLFSVWQE